ncbi:MAG: histidine phosphatase family protein [Propionicimonas sp.]|uniref:histidine phosphatase family protein n=1 Tax=Propionicimonas sp. TaxID=1955623 RepID=UPI002B215F7B|nr:histidine phosphatase family protein [Propionicimonas sp.]MEA4944923.1 histidine phosphatase family protein [Propionicimonas sp.]
MVASVVHVVRHGQVHNPDGVLYGRLPDYHLSELGRQMAERLGEYFADADLVWLVSSPLERARETMAPIAARHPELEVHLDERVIEAANHFEGTAFTRDPAVWRRPSTWWAVRNPLRPSWGEAYTSIATRMQDAICDAAGHAEGAEAVIVAHELPIWMARRSAEGKPFPHDPRNREARLASVTSFTFDDGELASVSYAEPAGDLLPVKTSKKFRPGS